jgi:hypothetical protein
MTFPRWLYEAEASSGGRQILKGTSYGIVAYPNPANGSTYGIINVFAQVNQTSIFAFVCKHSPTYAKVYVNGSSANTSSAGGDWTDPVWGATYFFLGSNKSGTSILSGAIASVTKFSRALSDAEALYATQILGI